MLSTSQKLSRYENIKLEDIKDKNKDNVHDNVHSLYKRYYMKKLLGKDFNNIFSILTSKLMLIKLTNIDEVHNGFKFKDGLNVDTILFNPTGVCRSGGFYFTDVNNFAFWLNYDSSDPMEYARVVQIPDDALVYIEDNKIKADKLILLERMRIVDLPFWNDDKFCIEAIKQNPLTLQYVKNPTSEMYAVALQQQNEGYSRLCSDSALFGRLDNLIWARKNGCNWDKYTCANAARNGHLEILKFARADLENICPWDSDTCANAALNGHINNLLWSHRELYLYNPNRSNSGHNSNNHFEILKWARANGCPWNSYTTAFAALNGRLDILQWAYTNGCPWDSNVCNYAAANGHLDVLEYARKNNCPWSFLTCEFAARGGHLHILKYARQNANKNNCPWNELTCAAAAKGGHLDVLIWARSNGCPWDRRTCENAARNGHLDVLIWARSNGNSCPWDYQTCLEAAHYNHQAILDWTIANNCECNGRFH